MKHTVVFLMAALAAATADAKPHNPDTDWFKDAGYGVFVHFLWDVQNVGGRANTMGKPPVSWDELVNGFDTEKFADQMKAAGAGYVMFTMMQRTRYLVAPNETYEKLTGYPRGEATSHRDLVEDLYASLHQRGIPLMLYWTGDGPRQDKQASEGLGGWPGHVTDAYVQNWANVAAEYSRRYGDKVKGWWVDGCYGHIGYNQMRWGLLAAGLKAGNARAIVALNNPSMTRASSSTDHDDYTTGEMNSFNDIPGDRWRDGKQFHVLSFLGSDWGHPGSKYTLDDLADYVSQVMAAGGVVTIDVCLYRDGSVDPAQIELLSKLRPAIKQAFSEAEDRAPMPPGNLACWKPARLLTLDGNGSLAANGGAGGSHGPRSGVDGDTNTTAQAGGQWPWTYEVDLLNTSMVNRVIVTFGSAHATQFELQLSARRSEWQTVAAISDHRGGSWTKTFAPVAARYVRVRGIKPDGPDQPGGQMSVAELGVYAGTQDHVPSPGSKGEGPARFVRSLQAGDQVTIVTLGTSLTGGTWRWVDVMKEWLDNDFAGLVTIHNLGVGASASSHPPGSSGLDKVKQAAALKPDAAFIEFAVNDAYLPYGISVEDAKRNLNTMIDALLAANPRVEIILQTMNVVVDEHATRRPRLGDYVEMYREVARERGVRLVDHYPNWQKLLDSGRDKFMALVPDGIHPQRAGYREILLPALKENLLGEKGRP
jgi:lysophospholipase L1-like esterase